MKTHRALILRVRRTLAGKTLPFDKIYFFPTSIGPIIPRIFPFSMVFALTAEFTRMVHDVVKMAAAHEAFPLRRENEKAINASFSAKDFDDVFKNRSKYWAVVPTLYLSHTMKDSEGGILSVESKPAYICASPERHYSRHGHRRTLSQEVTDSHQRERMDMLQSVKSYLLVDGEVYRPICLACPNHMEVLNGHCFFGSRTCYEQLAVVTPGAFVAGMRAYEQFKKGQTPEPELEGLA